MNNTDTKLEARTKIDAADKIIINITSEFNMRSNPDNYHNMSQERHDLIFPGLVEMWKQNTPNKLLTIATNPLDFSDKPEEEIRLLMLNLGKSLSNRFKSIEGVVLEKEKDGATSSYDKARHDAVINKFGNEFARLGNDYELGKLIGKSIADYFVEIQDMYLNYKTGPIAEYLASKKTDNKHAPPGWLQYKI